MRQATQTPTVIRFDSYELDLAAEELRKHGFPLKLQPQPFKILAYLASRPGEMVTRQELRARLAGRHVCRFRPGNQSGH